jgi:hypothetical protein
MRNPALSPAIRERVRRNVGRLAGPVRHLVGPVTAGRYGQLFDGHDLVGGIPDPASGVILPAPVALPTVPEGRILGVSILTTTGNREVALTDPLPAPCMIRAMTITGNLSIANANSFRILLANDTDTSAVADPTGTDLIEYAGDVIGAEDPGVHAHLTAGPLVVEPWRKVLVSGQRVKLKIHNVSGGTTVVALYLDLDALAP